MAKIKRRTEDGWEELYNSKTIEALTSRISALEDAWHSVCQRMLVLDDGAPFGNMQVTFDAGKSLKMNLYYNRKTNQLISYMSGEGVNNNVHKMLAQF